VATLLTVAAVARELDASPGYVRACIASGDLRAARIGRGYRIRREWLDAFLASREVRPAALPVVVPMRAYAAGELPGPKPKPSTLEGYMAHLLGTRGGLVMFARTGSPRSFADAQASTGRTTAASGTARGARGSGRRTRPPALRPLPPRTTPRARCS
jgi:excisionase family DNA binding protein